jgi:hypothetical protein
MSLHALLQETQHQCARCYYFQSPNYNGHSTINCPSDIIGPNSVYRITFRSSLILPPGVACYLCGVPFAPPFNHPFPLPFPSPIDPNNCAFPDTIKVLAYLIYVTPADRSVVFNALGLTPTMSMAAFSTWLGQTQHGRLLNLYELVVKYRELRLADRV